MRRTSASMRSLIGGGDRAGPVRQPVTPFAVCGACCWPCRIHPGRQLASRRAWRSSRRRIRQPVGRRRYRLLRERSECSISRCACFRRYRVGSPRCGRHRPRQWRRGRTAGKSIPASAGPRRIPVRFRRAHHRHLQRLQGKLCGSDRRLPLKGRRAHSLRQFLEDRFVDLYQLGVGRLNLVQGRKTRTGLRRRRGFRGLLGDVGRLRLFDFVRLLVHGGTVCRRRGGVNGAVGSLVLPATSCSCERQRVGLGF
jgi:hypothetical protein